MSARPVSVKEHGRRRAGVISGRARGWKTRRIAAELGLPHGTLRSWIERDARDLMPGHSSTAIDTTGWDERVPTLRGAGLSWPRVAARLGVSRHTLQRWRDAHPELRFQRDPAPAVQPTPAPEPEPEPEPESPSCRVVVWGEWLTRAGVRPSQIGLLAPAQIRLRGSDLHQVWSVDCTTCHKAWIGTDEEDAHRIADAHLADRTQPSATRKEAPRAI